MSQPENWTKDKLVSELKRQHVPLAPNMPKLYYVKLYREKVMGGARPNTRQRSEFSSDEETIIKRVSQSPRTKHYSKVVSTEHYTREISSYSDSKLMAELKKYGISAGPITVTTRGLYQKKLAQAMFDKTKKQAPPPISQSSSGVTIASGSDEEFSSGEEEVDKGKETRQESFRQPSSSYDLRSRSTIYKEKPLPPREQPKPVKPIKTPKPAKPETVARPYRASWCTGWIVLQFFCFLVSFVVALVVFDYVIYDKTRLIDWLSNLYTALLKYIGV